MGELIYSSITSLDGDIADENGNFDWAAPDDELHAFINDLERSAVMRDYADMWRSADKVVYSNTLDKVSSARTESSETSTRKPTAESDSRPRHHRGWSPSRRTGDQCWSGR